MNNVDVGMNVFVKPRKVVAIVTDMEVYAPCLMCPNNIGPCSDCAKATSIGKTKITMLSGHNNVIVGYVSDVEPIVTEVYKIGDKVMSTLGGGFVGEVTGFEYNTNKVICKSSRAERGTRSRYAYGLDEVVPYNEIKFTLGQKFRVNDKQQIIIMGAQNAKSEYCNVYNYQTNKLMWANVPLVNTVETLNSKYNISKLELLDTDK